MIYPPVIARLTKSAEAISVGAIEIATHLSDARNAIRCFSLLLHDPKRAHGMFRIARKLL